MIGWTMVELLIFIELLWVNNGLISFMIKTNIMITIKGCHNHKAPITSNH